MDDWRTSAAATNVLRGLRRGILEPIALRALLKATHLLGRALGARLAELRDSNDPLCRSHSRTEEEALHARLLGEMLEILLARLARIPERRRPHYTPHERFRILRLKVLLSHTQSEAARLCAVSPGTIARWEAEVAASPDAETVGSLIKPTPPVRRYADVVRHMVQAMALAGFEGKGMIARTLARAGWKLSASTVGRVRSEKPTPAPSPEPNRTSRHLTARYPNHIWMADITEITGLFRLFSWKLAVVFDVFSRMPLGWRVFDAEPSAAEIAALVDEAAKRHGSPKHFVSDQGTQFTAADFGAVIETRGIHHRFGALGMHGSIALIERFWRSLKAISQLKIRRPLVRRDIEGRACLALCWYADHRPHSALGGATPSETYSGATPACLAAIDPPRGRPGEIIPFGAPGIEFLDADRTLPILVARAA